MPKRLTATEKWNDSWFCGLTTQDKLFWIYLCDNCDHAGIFKVNWPLIKFHIQDYQFNESIFNGKIDFLNEETWFIKKFVLFQQKIENLTELNPSNKCHMSIINILSSKGLISPTQAPKKGLRRGQGIGIGNIKEKGVIGEKEFEALWLKYPKKIGSKQAERHFKASVRTQEDYEAINKAIENYLRSEEVVKGYIQNGATWFNNWRDWIGYEEKLKQPSEAL